MQGEAEGVRGTFGGRQQDAAQEGDVGALQGGRQRAHDAGEHFAGVQREAGHALVPAQPSLQLARPQHLQNQPRASALACVDLQARVVSSLTTTGAQGYSCFVILSCGIAPLPTQLPLQSLHTHWVFSQ